TSTTGVVQVGRHPFFCCATPIAFGLISVVQSERSLAAALTPQSSVRVQSEIEFSEMTSNAESYTGLLNALDRDLGNHRGQGFAAAHTACRFRESVSNGNSSGLNRAIHVDDVQGFDLGVPKYELISIDFFKLRLFSPRESSK